MCDKDYTREKNKATPESTDKLFLSSMLKLWRITALWELRTFSVANNLRNQIRRNHWGIKEQERERCGAGHHVSSQRIVLASKADLSCAVLLLQAWHSSESAHYFSRTWWTQWPPSSSAHICYRVTSERISHWARSPPFRKNKTSQIDLLLAQEIFSSSFTFL